MPKQLTQNAIEHIRSDNELASAIATAMGIRFTSLAGILTRNTRRLTEYPVLKVLSDHTKIPVDELLEEGVSEMISETN